MKDVMDADRRSAAQTGKNIFNVPLSEFPGMVRINEKIVGFFRQLVKIRFNVAFNKFPPGPGQACGDILL